LTRMDSVLVGGTIAALVALSAWAKMDWPAPLFFIGMGAVFGFVVGMLAVAQHGSKRGK